MSEQGADERRHAPGLWPVPGDGVLARHGDLILLCSLDDGQFVDVLLDLLEEFAESGGYGRRFADAIADVIESGSPADGGEAGPEPSVLAFGPAGAGLAIMVSGGAWAEVTTAAGTTRIEASHPGLLLRSLLRSAVSAVRGGLSPADNGAASTDRFSRLDAGTVRAGGLSFYQGGAASQRGQAAASPAAAGPAAGQAAAEAAAWAAGPDLAELAEPQQPDERPGQEAPGQEASGYDAADDESRSLPEQEAPEQEAPEPGASELPAASAVPFEPTAAWAAPGMPDLPTAPPPQATELWSMEQELAEHGPGVPPVDMMKTPGSDSADDAEREVTEPPGESFQPAESYQPAGQFPPAAQSPSYEPAGPFEAVLLGPGSGLDVPSRQPLAKAKDMPPGTSSYVSAGPIIQGVYCKNAHFDDPEALFCAICGISMNQQTLVPRPGERPPLGVLLLDDGAVFQLDSDYVVGREPSLDSTVAAGRARPLRVTDDAGIVSRVHARVHLEGWRVLVTDLGSANGTRVQLPGQPADQQLAPQVPVVLATGSQVDLGGRGFRYESHRGR